MGVAGISKETRDRIQGHAFNDVSSKHYDRYDYFKEKREGLRVWATRLMKVARSLEAARPPRCLYPSGSVIQRNFDAFHPTRGRERSRTGFGKRPVLTSPQRGMRKCGEPSTWASRRYRSISTAITCTPLPRRVKRLPEGRASPCDHDQ